MPSSHLGRPIRAVATLIVAAAVLAGEPRMSSAFSVLAHQGVVDRCWDSVIVPELQRRFPRATPEELGEARAFAYGGSHLPDLGYFPFGNRLFTDLLHYVRSGDFVESLLRNAETIEEYAFALGVFSHYVSDDTGHPGATNPTVAEIYPKLRDRYGDSVTYAEDPGAHLTTEFRFDVLQVAQSKQSPDLIHHALAFQVSEPVLDRAFFETYGLHLGDLFQSTTVAITTYRWAFRELIQEATGISWELYRADIMERDPSVTPAQFVASISRQNFEEEFGKTYREAGYFAKFFALVVTLVPNVGPLQRLPYKALPPDARERFTATFDRAVERYRDEMATLRANRLELPNENLDIGRPTRNGEYEPADDAYASLLEKLDDRDFAGVSSALRSDLLRFDPGSNVLGDDARRRKLEQALARLEATSPRP